MRNSSIAIAVSVVVAIYAATYYKDSSLDCRQSVVHNGEAKCAIYINKDLINDVK